MFKHFLGRLGGFAVLILVIVLIAWVSRRYPTARAPISTPSLKEKEPQSTALPPPRSDAQVGQVKASTDTGTSLSKGLPTELPVSAEIDRMYAYLGPNARTMVTYNLGINHHISECLHEMPTSGEFYYWVNWQFDNDTAHDPMVYPDEEPGISTVSDTVKNEIMKCVSEYTSTHTNIPFVSTPGMTRSGSWSLWLYFPIEKMPVYKTIRKASTLQ